ncbi:MAG: hypothetical protein JW932_16870 [Deltaproteobacteria bacterium]|nr:hypothetical protein [Deltaproteobacteria bacterium]
MPHEGVCPIDKTLFDKIGLNVAYLSDDYDNTIYLWDGHPVAYLFDDRHVYGMNGRHLGWLIDSIIFNHAGERVGFTDRTCPAPLAKELGKLKKYPKGEIRPRWQAPPLPKLLYQLADESLEAFLKEGQVALLRSGNQPGRSSLTLK